MKRREAREALFALLFEMSFTTPEEAAVLYETECLEADRDLADDYIPLFIELVERGFSVLAFDVAGSYSSSGDSMVGMCRSLVDMDSVMTFAESDERFSQMPKLVMGFSWGGYAASSVLSLHKDVKAAVLISPMNDGASIMIEKSFEYAGHIVYSSKPIFDIYQRYLFGDYVEYNGVRGINSTDIPVLIAQGRSDTVLTPDAQSITAHLDEITNPNVEVYWGEGLQGSHSGVWHSKEAMEYKNAFNDEIASREAALGRALTDVELAEIYKNVDHRLYSAVNDELIELIISTFSTGLGL